MKKNKIFLIMAMFFFTLSANAQNEENATYTFNPHWFLQLQAGGQYTRGEAKFNELLSPNAQIAVGYQFTPVWALRLAANGWQSKGGWKEDMANSYGFPNNTFKWNYVTPALDVKFNLINAIAGYNRNRIFGLNLIAGIGANIAFGNDEAGDLYAINPTVLSHYYDGTSIKPVGRVGLDLDFRCSDRVTLNLEGIANGLTDHYNSKHAENADWYFNVLAGVKIALGKTCTKKVEEEWATRVDTIWYDDITYTPRVEDGTITWNVFYKIRESDFNDPDAQLAAIGAFLKDHRECKVSIKSYADVQTGNPKINMGYSQQRSEKAVKALVDAGVDPSIITAEYFGDTVQPFAENDKNRVSIIKATGLKDVKDKNTVKKFRTKEVRYRVH